MRDVEIGFRGDIDPSAKKVFADDPLAPLSILLLLAILLTSCASSTPTVATEEPTSTRTPQALGPTSTSTEALPTETPSTAPPTAEPVAPISDDDWSRGPQDAEVTILIYSDFQ